MLDVAIQLQRGAFQLDMTCKVSGGVTGIFGPSGAGKTTLLHALAGLYAPVRGRIVLDRRVLFDSDGRIHVPPHRRELAIVFQDHRLFPHLGVRRNLNYGAKAANSSASDLSFDDVVDLLDIGDLLHRRCSQLSGGQRQRVALGRALLTQPRLLLLDEPLASLDVGLKRQILPLLARVRDATGIPMLLVSHDIGDILQLTDSLLIVDRGRLLAQGRFREVLADSAVFNLANSLGLENVLAVAAAEHRPADGLTVLQLSPAADDAPTDPTARNPLLGPLLDCPVGTELHVAIRPEDIALATGPVSGVSIQNQVPGRVGPITVHGGRVLVEVDVGRPLLAELSLKAIDQLGIAEGATVFCLIKAHAIRYLDR
ncbi:MAG: molybdenum ABC transporter ATP-binding protein [Phycisphaerae bacterium]